MNKIVITSFCMPNELDDLERVLIDLNKASKYIDSSIYEFHISISVDDYLVDWENSLITKEFILKRFYSLKPLTDWASNSTFQNKSNILGSLSSKISAYNDIKNATHFIWLDSDICFDEKILFHIQNSIDVIEENGITDKYIITPEIVRYWDSTWDCLVNDSFLDKPLNYCKSNNPFQDCGEKGNVSLENVINTIQGQPTIKYGAGWFTCISKKLLDRIPIPSSMGHYGPGDDTFLMWGIDKLNKISNTNIMQFKLKNYVVCENFKYRDRSHYDGIIKFIDRKQEFREIAEKQLSIEYEKLI